MYVLRAIMNKLMYKVHVHVVLCFQFSAFVMHCTSGLVIPLNI